MFAFHRKSLVVPWNIVFYNSLDGVDGDQTSLEKSHGISMFGIYYQFSICGLSFGFDSSTNSHRLDTRSSAWSEKFRPF